MAWLAVPDGASRLPDLGTGSAGSNNGEDEMTKKADFNAEEWSTVAEAPLLAAMRVVTAARGGTIRESLAIGQTYARARQAHGESELLDDLVSAPPSIDPAGVRAGGDLGSVSTARLRDALQLLEQKASSAEIDSYKHFVMTVAQAAAAAHKEGGFMGVGGKQVSDDEQSALDDIAAVLELDAEASRPPDGREA